MPYITPDRLMAKRLGNRPRPEWRSAILCFRDAWNSRLLTFRAGAKPLERRLLYGLDPEPGEDCVCEMPLASGSAGIVTRCLWGGPQAAILAEELAWLGVRYIIGFGCAGALDETLHRGNHVVAISGLATDGTSRCYTGAASASPDPRLLDLTMAAARDVNVELRSVTVATVDALYRETPEAVTSWRALGAQAINMETSPLYAACAALGIKCVWIGYITDRLVGEWEDWFGDQLDTQEEAIELCLELVRRIGEE